MNSALYDRYKTLRDYVDPWRMYRVMPARSAIAAARNQLTQEVKDKLFPPRWDSSCETVHIYGFDVEVTWHRENEVGWYLDCVATYVGCVAKHVGDAKDQRPSGNGDIVEVQGELYRLEYGLAQLRADAREAGASKGMAGWIAQNDKRETTQYIHDLFTGEACYGFYQVRCDAIGLHEFTSSFSDDEHDELAREVNRLLEYAASEISKRKAKP